MKYPLSLLLLIALAGCVTTKDMTGEARFVGELKLGGSYQFLKPAFLYDFNGGRLFFDKYPVTPGFWLLPERFTKYGSFMLTPTVGEYHAKKTKGIEGVIPRGVSLTFDRIIYYNYFEGETSYYVFRIADGAFTGREVCLNELMIEGPDRLTRTLDPALIQKK